MIYITADTHLGHTNILKYDGRPFDTIDDHDNAIIRRWNSKVKPNDTVYHLGDVALTSISRAARVVHALNGRIILIKGNHESTALDLHKRDNVFEAVHSYYELKDHGDLFCLFHYPIHEWNKCHHGAYMLHGHTHGNDSYSNRYRILNVGINLHGYYPLSLDEIREMLSDRVIRSHH
jgi:calcineurin-like phosphoesterase family protein